MRASLTLILFLTAPFASATKVDLVCPCEVRSQGQTAMTIRAGIDNTENTDAGELRLRVIAHPTVSHFDSPFHTLGYFRFGSGLDANSMIVNEDRLTGLRLPPEGTSYLTLALEEAQNDGFDIVEFHRLEDSVQFSNAGGESVGSGDIDRFAAIFFDGTPTIDINGDEVTIDVPPIVSQSVESTSGNLVLDIIQASGESIFGHPFFEAATIDLEMTIGPNSRLEATEITTGFSEQSNDDFDWFHLRLRDESIEDGTDVLAWETVRVRGSSIQRRSFERFGIEVLADDDGDGVSNYNETLKGSDANDTNDVPDKPTIDLMYFYTTGAVEVSNNDIDARLDQITEVTNQIYGDSGAGLAFNDVHRQHIELEDSTSLSTVLDRMFNEEPPFEDLRDLKESTGADIAVVFMPTQSGDDLCGLATLSGAGLEADFASNSIVNDAHATVYIDCRDSVTAHEIGHVMGLTHSRVEMRNENDPVGGTFPWSVGHGVDESFVTVMANRENFGGAPELNIFSSPKTTCEGVPCGVTRTDDVDGADAVLSLNAVRYQVAGFTATAVAASDYDGDGIPDEEDPDDDNDGVADEDDAFPLDETEWKDTDGDGIGNNADTDDDGDGFSDVLEMQLSSDPLEPDCPDIICGKGSWKYEIYDNTQ